MSGYSQGAEEEIIEKVTRDLRSSGYVLDIGAFDGQTYSNSRALLLRGWRGLLVEPSPFAFAELLKLYVECRHITLVNAVIGFEAGHLAPFHEGGLYGTTSHEVRNRWASTAKYSRDYWVPQVTVSQLVNQFAGAPDVISVDTEGTSFEIVKSLPEPWVGHARVIVVEHDDRAVEISEWGRAHGFDIFYLDPQNLILVKRG